MTLLNKICEALDTTQVEYERINIAMTLEVCVEEFERADLDAMIDTLGVTKAAPALLHDLAGFRDRHDKVPGSDCWLPQSNGYTAAGRVHNLRGTVGQMDVRLGR